MLTHATPSPPNPTLPRGRTERLRHLALRALPQLYRPDRQRFAFRLRRTPGRLQLEGESARYTAIVLIGLAGEAEDDVRQALRGDRPGAVLDALAADVPATRNLGDTALLLWAAWAWKHPARHDLRLELERRLARPAAPPTVELAWALAALCHDAELRPAGVRLARTAYGLLDAFSDAGAVFAHQPAGSTRWRPHVTCFADLVYPVHALALYHRATGDRRALAVARRCADHIVELQGPAGQWWWHYDTRSGAVLERYPVYAVHQDGMAPLALRELAEAGGPDHRAAVERGLDWLDAAPELDGGSLIDEARGLIWRKVGRRERWKLARRLQAGVGRVRPGWRVPAIDRLMPPGVVDWETRAYHFGWLLYAFRRAGTPEPRAEGGR